MKIRKFGLVAAMAAAVVLASGSLAMAQDQKAPEGKKKGFMNPQQRVERMATELKLTDDQKTKLTAAFEEQATKMRELRQDTNLSQEQRQEKMRALMEDNNKKMKEILTADQFAQWEKMRDQFKKGGPKGEPKAEKKSE